MEGNPGRHDRGHGALRKSAKAVHGQVGLVNGNGRRLRAAQRGKIADCGSLTRNSRNGWSHWPARGGQGAQSSILALRTWGGRRLFAGARLRSVESGRQEWRTRFRAISSPRVFGAMAILTDRPGHKAGALLRPDPGQYDPGHGGAMPGQCGGQQLDAQFIFVWCAVSRRHIRPPRKGNLINESHLSGPSKQS